MKYSFSKENSLRIIDFETKTFLEYKKVVDSYLPYFLKCGCTLKLEMEWRNPILKTWAPVRLPMKNGYKCYIYCVVQKDGEDVQIKSNDGEADYYSLSMDCMISSIYRRFLELKISLFTGTDDLENALKDFLLQIENI